MVGEVYQTRSADIKRAMKSETSAISGAHLQDFDWKVQVGRKLGLLLVACCLLHAETTVLRTLLSPAQK